MSPMQRTSRQIILSSSVAIVLVALVIPRWAAAQARPSTRPTVIPTTEQFESGQLKLSEVSDRMLIAFRADLNRRKDYDYSCHGGQPGPNAAFLWDWVQKVEAELTHRGWTIDKDGNLRDNSIAAGHISIASQIA